MGSRQYLDTIGLFSHNPLNGVGLWSEEMSLFESLLPKTPYQYVETGSHNGGSALLSYLYRRASNITGNELCIDPQFGEYFDLNVKRAGANLHKCIGTVNDMKKFAARYQMIEEKELRIDVAFIDGLHSFKQVLKDFDGLKPYLTDNATIIFHDNSPRLQHKEKRKEILKWTLDNFDELMRDETENFRCDEAYCYLEHTENLAHIDCHIDCYHPQETGLTGWVRGKTSPHSAIAALRKK